MKFEENGKFFVISYSFINYLIKKGISNTFWIDYKNKTVKVSIEIKENK